MTAASLLIAACSGSAGGDGQASDGPSAPTSSGAEVATTGECRAEATGPETFVYAVRDGSEPHLTSLDVMLPAGCGPVPVLVWVHGGGWRRGDKTDPSVVQKTALANGVGAALVSVNYRLSSPDNEVRWPDHGDDVADALAWIAAEGPSHGLDPTRIALIGHSAGGHLVSIVATDPELRAAAGLDDGSLRCVIPIDTEGYDLGESAAMVSGLVSGAFGADPGVIAEASPVVQIARHGAPAANWLVLTRGGPARVATAAAFVDVVRAGGGEADLLHGGGYDHDEVNRAVGRTGELVVTPTVTGFLRTCLA